MKLVTPATLYHTCVFDVLIVMNMMKILYKIKTHAIAHSNVNINSLH